MPYRRLPNTDKARLKAMNMAIVKGDVLDMFDLAFSQKLLNQLNSFMPIYEHAIYEYQQGLARQVESNRTHQEMLKKAKLYVSHYIQALNMAVMRGEVKAVDQEFLGLEQGTKSLPTLNTENCVIEWGAQVINGDAKRLAQGGVPIYCPSMANVRVHFERFKESYSSQQFLKSNTHRLLEKVSELRDQGDTIILEIWNAVEQKCENIVNVEKRLDACREYGLNYYYRKGEEQTKAKIKEPVKAIA
jgi:hypothetical protein